MNDTSLVVVPLVRYQVETSGRKTPTVSRPSSFQSPAIGRSPDGPWPNLKVWSVVVVPLVRYQVETSGRNTPTVSRRSPFQSPTTGRSPDGPEPNLKVRS